MVPKDHLLFVYYIDEEYIYFSQYNQKGGWKHLIHLITLEYAKHIAVDFRHR